MISEHEKLCKEFGIDATYKLDSVAYPMLVERLNAALNSANIKLSCLVMRNHRLEDAVERNEIL